jgi:hypothetical protein
VKSRREVSESKYFSGKARRPNPLYLRKEAFGGIAQRGATVYLLNKPAFRVLSDYVNRRGVTTDQLRLFKEMGLI